MKSLNRFIKGIRWFKDNTLYQPDEWTFPSSNVRITDYDNKGLAITFTHGNVSIDEGTLQGEKFLLPTDFVPLGSNEYNGVLYIVSVNETTGEGQVGSYPSPIIGVTSSHDFERVYKPFNNFDALSSGTPGEFTTILFNFDTEHQVDVQIKEIYDGSVNLYIADYKNPNIVINSGFTQQGLNVGNIYTDTDFEGSIYLIPFSNKQIKADLGAIPEGGNLKPGMYHFFFRYTTSDLVKTRFVGKTFPVQIGVGTTWSNYEGSYEKTYEGLDVFTNKQIELIFNSDLNTGFDYIEIAYIRYSEDATGVPIQDSNILDKKYKISDLLVNPSVFITGREPTLIFTKEELLINTNIFNASKSQAIVDSRYFGANWKGIEYDRAQLAHYASLIKMGYALSDKIDDNDPMDIDTAQTVGKKYQHKVDIKGQNTTFKLTGHFRGETYPFAIKFIMSNGSTTEAFPTTGYYERIAGTKLLPNDKGIYTFPFFTAASSSNIGIDSHHYALAAIFDNTDAITYLNDNEPLFRNVRGIIFLRGNKIENLLYQGVVSDIISGISWIDQGSDLNTLSFNSGRRAAWIRPFTSDVSPMPYCIYGGNEDPTIGFEKSEPHPGQASQRDTSKIGIYAPDYLFEDDISDNGKNIQVCLFKKYGYGLNGNIDPLNDAGVHVPNFAKSPIGAEGLELDNEAYLNQSVEITNYSNLTFPGLAYFPKDGVRNMIEGFQTIANLGETSGPDYFLSADMDSSPNHHPPYPTSIDWNTDTTPVERLSSLGYATSRYIGIDLDTDIYNENQAVHLANVYNNVPDEAFYNSIIASYNPSTSMYYDISESYDLDIDTSIIPIYKGDCFLQRVYFRAHFAWDPGNQFAQYDDNTTGTYNANYGFLLSAIIESKINNAMRNEVEYIEGGTSIIYTYYPKLLSRGIFPRNFLRDWKDERFRYEAFYVNSGYNEIINSAFAYGADLKISQLSSRRFTRIYFSVKSHAGEIRDNFRLISILSFQDYPLEKGEIFSIKELGGTLISIQENAVSQHHLGQQQLSNTSSGDIVTERTGLYLAEQVKPLSFYGTTSQWSVIKIGNNIFGVDYNRRIIWMVGSIPNQQGGVSFGSKDLSLDTQIEGWIKNLLDTFDVNNDIIDKLPDNPLNGFGIVSGSNSKYKEINFTFHLPVFGNYEYALPSYNGMLTYPQYSTMSGNGCFFSAIQEVPPGNPPPLCGDIDIFWLMINLDLAKTLDESFYIFAGDVVKVFNLHGSGRYYVSPMDKPITEDDLMRKDLINYIDVAYDIDISQSETIVFDSSIMSFVGTQPYKPAMYFALGLNMFTSNLRMITELRNFIYLHDIKTCEIGNFYGTKHESVLSLIVVGADAREVVKLFNNYTLESNDEVFSKIEFFTDYQESSIDPFIDTDKNKFYIKPEYLENMWHGPIEANEVGNQLYDLESEMRGTWLKIVLTYNGDNEQFVRKVLVDFIQSFI